MVPMYQLCRKHDVCSVFCASSWSRVRTHKNKGRNWFWCLQYTQETVKTLVHLSKCWYKIYGGRGLSLEHTVSLWWENILFLVDKYRSNLSTEMSVHYSPVNAL